MGNLGRMTLLINYGTFVVFILYASIECTSLHKKQFGSHTPCNYLKYNDTLIGTIGSRTYSTDFLGPRETEKEYCNLWSKTLPPRAIRDLGVPQPREYENISPYH